MAGSFLSAGLTNLAQRRSKEHSTSNISVCWDCIYICGVPRFISLAELNEGIRGKRDTIVKMYDTTPSLMLNEPIKQQGEAEHSFLFILLTTKTKLIQFRVSLRLVKTK